MNSAPKNLPLRQASWITDSGYLEDPVLAFLYIINIVCCKLERLHKSVTYFLRVAGLEMVKYMDRFNKADMFYWQHMSRNGNAEVDYLTVRDSQILPVEIKSGVQGGMQSLYLFMREKKLVEAVRSSLENFGQFVYVNSIARGSRHVEIILLYALSNLHKWYMA